MLWFEFLCYVKLHVACLEFMLCEVFILYERNLCYVRVLLY